MATTRINTPDKYIFGRPAIYDIDEEGQALLDWAQKDASLELIEFANERGYWSGNLSEWANDNKEFSKALKKAKDLIATRRSRLVSEGKLNYGVYQRYQGMYDQLLRHDEREEKVFEAGLRMKQDEKSAEINAQALAKACKELNDKS